MFPIVFLYMNLYVDSETKTSLVGAITCGFVLIIAQFSLTGTYLWLTIENNFMTTRRGLDGVEADLQNCE
jgi:hypothetical protein